MCLWHVKCNGFAKEKCEEINLKLVNDWEKPQSNKKRI